MIFKDSTKKGDFDSYAFTTTWHYGYDFMKYFMQVIIDIDFKGKVDRLAFAELPHNPINNITEELVNSKLQIKNCPSLSKEQGLLGLSGFSNTLKKNVQFWLFNQTNYFEIDVLGEMDNINSFTNYLNSIEILTHKKLAVANYLKKNSSNAIQTPNHENTNIPDSKKIEKETNVENTSNSNFINLGILGNYPKEQVLNEVDEDRENDALNFIKSFEDNISSINIDIFNCIYTAFSDSAFPMWEYPEFDKFIDRSKLPENFNELDVHEKERLFYDYTANDNLINVIGSYCPALLIDKLKDDIKITNVTLNLDYNPQEISIEFNGICNFFYAMISFQYKDNKFKVSEFSAS